MGDRVQEAIRSEVAALSPVFIETRHFLHQNRN